MPPASKNRQSGIEAGGSGGGAKSAPTSIPSPRAHWRAMETSDGSGRCAKKSLNSPKSMRLSRFVSTCANIAVTSRSVISRRSPTSLSVWRSSAMSIAPEPSRSIASKAVTSRFRMKETYAGKSSRSSFPSGSVASSFNESRSHALDSSAESIKPLLSVSIASKTSRSNARAVPPSSAIRPARTLLRHYLFGKKIGHQKSQSRRECFCL